jgi:copper(I)-binding protein
MFRRLVLVLISLLLLTLAAPTSFAHSEPDALVITNIWARATQMAEGMSEATPAMPMGEVSAAYMNIANTGDHTVRLIAAASSVAAVVEIHETTMSGDVMQMRPVEGGIELPGGESVALEPGGLHIMLLELTAPLVAGEALSLTLTFDVVTDDGTLAGEPFEQVIGALIASEPPATSAFAISGIWARPTAMPATGDMSATPEAAMSDVSAVYMTLTNTGENTDRLISAATDAAGIVEIHESTMNGDVMQMREIEGGIELPTGESVALMPGGLHVMLLELPAPLVAGEAFPLTLTFESGAEVTIAVPIYDRMSMMLGE